MKVSELLFKIKNLLEGNLELRDIWVEGELRQAKTYNNSYIYFNLKDEQFDSIVECFVGKEYYAKVIGKTEWKDGVKLKVFGYISVWNKHGTFKLIVQNVEKDDGLGQKYLQLEQLKKKLEAEGLFDPKHKKRIPQFAQKIGIITSLNGAAIHDIYNTMKKNSVFIEVILFPSLVQGDAAPQSLINALLEADSWGLDLIIITRGGGSFEDLFCFNDEQLARTIFQLKTPIISAVGHQTDVTICDFVADLRVATPTQSVNELPNFYQEYDNLIKLQQNLSNSFFEKIKLMKSEILHFHDFLYLKLQNYFNNQNNMLSTLLQQIENLLKNMILNNQNLLSTISQELKNHFQNTLIEQSHFINNQYSNINYLIQTIIQKQIDFFSTQNLELKHQILYLLQNEKNFLKSLELEMESYDHSKMLDKGYSITLRNGKVLKSIHEVQNNDKIQTLMKDGSIISQVIKK